MFSDQLVTMETGQEIHDQIDLETEIIQVRLLAIAMDIFKHRCTYIHCMN